MSLSPVLYAEDEENDVFLMQRAFRKAGVTNPLQIASDGAQAIGYLEGTGDYADRKRFPLPRLLLLDLNLPRQSGLEVLKWVRERKDLKSLPVVILTSSSQDSDIATAQSLGANGYLVKPASADKLIELVSRLRDCCLQPPSGRRGGWLDLKGNLSPSQPPDQPQ